MALLVAAVALAAFTRGALRWLVPQLPDNFRTPVRLYIAGA